MSKIMLTIENCPLRSMSAWALNRQCQQHWRPPIAVENDEIRALRTASWLDGFLSLSTWVKWRIARCVSGASRLSSPFPPILQMDWRLKWLFDRLLLLNLRIRLYNFSNFFHFDCHCVSFEASGKLYWQLV